MFVPGTGTNFMPREFTKGCSFVAEVRAALSPLPPPNGAAQWQRRVIAARERRRGFMFLVAAEDGMELGIRFVPRFYHERAVRGTLRMGSIAR